MVKEKGFDIMIEALEKIHRVYPEVVVIMVGGGPQRKHLENMALGYGVEGQVEFLDWVLPDDIPALINSSTVFVIPSRWEEPFGLVAIKTAQMQRPVVAACVGGLKEIIKEDVTDMFFKRGDADNLAKTLLSLLKNPSRAKKLGISARGDVMKRFSMESYIEQYNTLYNASVKGDV